MKLLMRISIACLIGCMGLGGQAATANARAAKRSLNRIQRLSLRKQGEQELLVLQGSQKAQYTTFALDDPPRLVVDIQGADLRALHGPFAYKPNHLVRTINVRQFTSPTQSIGRLVILLRPDTRWLLQKHNKQLLVAFRHNKMPRLKASGALAAVSKAQPVAPKAQPALPARAGKAPADHRLPSRFAGKRPPQRSGVVYRSGLRQGPESTRVARRLLGINVSKQSIVLRTNGSVAQYELLTLRDPHRLVVDLYQVRRYRRTLRRRLRRLSCRTHPFRSVRFGRHFNKLRLVFDLCSTRTLPQYRARFQRRGLRVEVASADKHSARIKQAKVEQPKVARSTSAPQHKSQTPRRLPTGPTKVTELGFGATQEASTLLLGIQGKKPRIQRRDVGSLVLLDLWPARLSPAVQKELDLSSTATVVESARVFPRGDGVRLELRLKKRTDVDWSFKQGLLRVKVEHPATQHLAKAKTSDKDDSYRITYHPRRVGQAGTPSAPSGAPGSMSAGDMAILSRTNKRRRYRGRRISIFFRKVDIHNLLRLFAEISGLNIITSSNVRGSVTLRLRNVPWDQALDLVLKTLKLGMEREGNIVRIATLSELRQEEQERRRLAQLKLLGQPQKIRLIPVNYAQATQMSAKVKTVLSPRGKVSVDNRTNVLIVKDYVPFLIRAEGLVKNLDTQTPQVLIETRIVEANINFDQQFGIQWGGHLLFSPLTGNGTGLQFPNPVGVRGGVPGQPVQGDGSFGTPNYVINFPATVNQGRGTALSFLFGTLSGAANLNLRLSAAESTGHVKIISAPKIITLHKMSASIQQGLQIPFTSASAAGTNVQFITASLQLTVSPQVTTDGSIFLEMNITNNQPDFSRGGAAGPAISTKTAQTKMLIKDGETMVIGGIYSRRTGTSQSRVPFLSRIPVLGLLFKNYTYNDDRAELLIFVTPRIINRAQTLGGRQGS